VAISDGLFALVSLLLGFTLTLAAARFFERRSLLIEESNSIGTTYLRAVTLPHRPSRPWQPIVSWLSYCEPAPAIKTPRLGL
jgi:hypothetical protein